MRRARGGGPMLRTLFRDAVLTMTAALIFANLSLGPASAASVVVVESITPSTFGVDARSHLVAMPTVVNSGDLLLCLFSNDGNTLPGAPAGWTRTATWTSSNAVRLSVFMRSADGTEDAR